MKSRILTLVIAAALVGSALAAGMAAGRPENKGEGASRAMKHPGGAEPSIKLNAVSQLQISHRGHVASLAIPADWGTHEAHGMAVGTDPNLTGAASLALTSSRGSALEAAQVAALQLQVPAQGFAPEYPPRGNSCRASLRGAITTSRGATQIVMMHWTKLPTDIAADSPIVMATWTWNPSNTSLDTPAAWGGTPTLDAPPCD